MKPKPPGGKNPWEWKIPAQPAEMQSNTDTKLSPQFEAALKAHVVERPLEKESDPKPEPSWLRLSRIPKAPEQSKK